MAIEFMEAVWQISPHKAEKLLVQLACADWADENGEFWPTYDALAKKARTTRPGVIRIVEQLIEEGEIELLEKGGGRGKNNRYRFGNDYLETVSTVRQTWKRAREKKGHRGLPNTSSQRVREDDSLSQETVILDAKKSNPEISHIRNNRHEPSERERDAREAESSPSPKLALVSSVSEPTPPDQPFSPNDDFRGALPAREWTIAERFVLKSCGLWDDLNNCEKPIVETNWKTKQAVVSAGRFIAPRLDVKARIGGTPKLFLEYWHDEIKRTATPRPEYVVEQWEAYDRWLINNYETHRRLAA